MKPILETDSNFICDIEAPCFQLLTQEEAELVRSGKTQVLFRKGDNLTKQGYSINYDYPMPGFITFAGINLHF